MIRLALLILATLTASPADAMIWPWERHHARHHHHRSPHHHHMMTFHTRKLDVIHQQYNSRMDQLLAATGLAKFAEGEQFERDKAKQ